MKRRYSNKKYKISCADWETVVEDENSKSACSKALKNMLEKHGPKLNVGFWMHIETLNSRDQDYEFIDVSSVFADLGCFKLSKNLSELSDFFLDKGKNPH